MMIVFIVWLLLFILQQELAAVFKKIGDKQTCTIGLYELYRITQLYPQVYYWLSFFRMISALYMDHLFLFSI